MRVAPSLPLTWLRRLAVTGPSIGRELRSGDRRWRFGSHRVRRALFCRGDRFRGTVMRSGTLAHLHPPAAIALLPVLASSAACGCPLVAPARSPYALAPGIPRAPARAVPVSPVASRADADLPVAPRAVEEPEAARRLAPPPGPLQGGRGEGHFSREVASPRRPTGALRWRSGGLTFSIGRQALCRRAGSPSSRASQPEPLRHLSRNQIQGGERTPESGGNRPPFTPPTVRRRLRRAPHLGRDLGERLAERRRLVEVGPIDARERDPGAKAEVAAGLGPLERGHRRRRDAIGSG